MGRSAGLVRADGETVTSASADDKVVIQKYSINSGQYEPRLISVSDLITGSGTGLTAASVPFIDSNGDLTEDNTNLNFNNGTNTLTATNLQSNAIVSTSNITTSANLICDTVGGGLRVKTGANSRAGITTLGGGSVNVFNSTITANTLILLTVQTLGVVTAPQPLYISARTNGFSFTITSADSNDESVVAWFLVELIP